MDKVLVAGVIGYPVHHSLSPEIFHWIARRLNQPTIYSKIEISPEELESHLRVFRNLSFLTGWNVTIPHKQSVIPWLDSISDEAKSVGAVNVVKVDHGKWRGFNTDVMGIRETFREHRLTLKDRVALVIGAGGAALAVSHVLGGLQACQVYIANRNFSRAEMAAHDLHRQFPHTLFQAMDLKDLSRFEEPVELYVNATPLGMTGFGQQVYFPKRAKVGSIAFDVVYRPEETPFLKFAEQNGLRTVGGLDMLVWQAIGAWEIWVSQTSHRNQLKEDLKKFLRIKMRALDV